MQAWLKIRRNQLLLGILVLVGAAAGFFLMTHSGSSSAPTALPSAPAPGAVPSPQPSQGSGHHGSPKSVLVLTGRNPFQCVICPSPSPTASASPGAVTQQVAGTVTTNASGESVSGHSVSLHGTFSRSGQLHARVTVDGVTYVPAVGETFAGHFELASAGGGCARLLYGDASFTLCMPS
jgi:hypothetical protein